MQSKSKVVYLKRIKYFSHILYNKIKVLEIISVFNFQIFALMIPRCTQIQMSSKKKETFLPWYTLDHGRLIPLISRRHPWRPLRYRKCSTSVIGCFHTIDREFPHFISRGWNYSMFSRLHYKHNIMITWYFFNWLYMFSLLFLYHIYC